MVNHLLEEELSLETKVLGDLLVLLKLKLQLPEQSVFNLNISME
jgi:hypothetical protein